jgi:hypothetical protein
VVAVSLDHANFRTLQHHRPSHDQANLRAFLAADLRKSA